MLAQPRRVFEDGQNGFLSVLDFLAMHTLLNGDAIEQLRTLPGGSVHCILTSPPYYGLRSYLSEHDPLKKFEIGLKGGSYTADIVAVFRECKRVLRDDGTLWLNIGDVYEDGDLCGIPWIVARCLQSDGWIVRQEIVWCLSGGTHVYARSQKGDSPMTVKDLSRLDPSTVKLWNGKKWTQLLGVSKSSRTGQEIEIVLRSGERISCTPTHKFPTPSGVVEARDLRVGDSLTRCSLPEPDEAKDCVLDEDAAWLAGLFLAEGSCSNGKISIAGHIKERERWITVRRIAAKFGGTATISERGNNQTIRVYGKILIAIIKELVSGKTSRDKGFSPSVWRYSNKFIAAMLDGYLSGDGHAEQNRVRLGFCRNYNLERDLRTACARLGYTITLNLSRTAYKGKRFQSFKGEIRKKRSGHHNERDRCEIVAIKKSRCRQVYDLGVADEPHLFSLASGVLTHNSKPSPMPESVSDRCTRSHEMIFMLAKTKKYFYDAEAIKEPSDSSPTGKNRRDVWRLGATPYKGAHFATMPTTLAELCIEAGTSRIGCCPTCGSPWVRVIEKEKITRSRPNDYVKRDGTEGTGNSCANSVAGVATKTLRWDASCECGKDLAPVPCTVLDPFAGSGTTLAVAESLGRNSIGIELNSEYVELAEKRLAEVKASPKQRRMFS